MVLVGIYREPLARILTSDSDPPSPMHVIDSESDMRKALTAPHAIIFAHVSWSMHSMVANKVVDKFAHDWKQSGKAPKITFYFLDLTEEPNPNPAYVTNWLNSDSRLSGLSSRGSGDVVWLRNGTVEAWAPAYDSTAAELNLQTKKHFKN